MNFNLKQPYKDPFFLGVSALAHALLLLVAAGLLWRGAALPQAAILTVETIQGPIPQGRGSGAPGAAKRMAASPPSQPSPLARSLDTAQGQLRIAPKPEPRRHPPHVNPAPSLDQLRKEEASMPIGLKPQQANPDQLSQGGLGDAEQPGSQQGAPQITGAIGSRGYRAVDWGFPKDLPEEATLVITITVAPGGLVRNVQLTQASGYPQIDQIAIEKAKSMVFDPLPADAPQVDMQGQLTFNFQYKH